MVFSYRTVELEYLSVYIAPHTPGFGNLAVRRGLRVTS